jgi:gliding motility-associated protein GldM
MAGGKETARQKMINIMYLVLLAMLALNVSDTILNAFKNINDSLDASKTNVTSSLDQLFSAFQNTELKNKPERAKPIWDKAQLARKYSDDLINDIQKLKEEFASQGGGIDEETGDLVERSNQDIATDIMINKKEGVKLKAKINATREKLIALLDAKDRPNVSFSLDANDARKTVGKSTKWEDVNFGEGTPLTAANTILTKIQSDVRNAEAEIVKKLFSELNPTAMTFDAFKAVAVPSSSYVIQGQPYKAEIFLTAADSKSNPEISVNGNSITVDKGVGVYTGGTSSTGEFTWKGTIRVKQANGEVKTYETTPQTYQVGKPSAVISSDKLNVIYAGIPNPFTVSAPGFPNVSASISGGSMSGSGGKFIVNVPASMIGREVSISVSGKNGANSLSLGSQRFRVKAIPPPITSFGGKTAGGTMSAARMGNINQVDAVYDNFEFDLKARVTSFSVTVYKPRQEASTFPCSGNNFSSQAKNALNALPYGTAVFLRNIIAQLPDGRTKQLNDMIFNIN